MTIYIFTALFLFAGSLSKSKDIMYKIGFIWIFFLAAFRNPLLGGSDYYEYSAYFKAVPNLLNWSSMTQSYFEVGYRFLNSIVKLFSNEYILFQIVYSIIVFILFYRVIRELELNDFERCVFIFSFFCFHYIWDMWVILRQNIADLIFWILVILIYKHPEFEQRKKIILVVMAVVIPTLFHKTAVVNSILLPIMWLLGKIPSKKRLVIVPIVSILLYEFGNPIYNFAVNLGTTYLRASYANYGTTASSFINYIIRLFFFVLFAWHYDREHCVQKKVVLDSLTMMVLIGSFNNIVTTRLYEYYAVGLYASMALFLNSFKKSSRKVVYPIYGMVMIFIMMRFIYNFDGGTMFTQYSLFI